MNDRWRTACHEAGHAVSAIALGGRCDGLTVFHDDGGGLAQIDELLGNRDAYAVAAGPAAEVLVDRFQPPETFSTETPTVDTIEQLPIFETAPRLACQMVRTPDSRKHHGTDEWHIALWAIRGHEDDPESWAGRVEHVHRVAAGIVTAHADEIERVARALYQRGSLGRDEILQLMGDA